MAEAQGKIDHFVMLVSKNQLNLLFWCVKFLNGLLLDLLELLSIITLRPFIESKVAFSII